MGNFGRSDNQGPDFSDPTNTRDIHLHDDVDSGPRAHHHTLGKGVNQSAPGAETNERLTALEDKNAEVKSWSFAPMGANFDSNSAVIVDVTGLTGVIVSDGPEDIFHIDIFIDAQSTVFAAGSIATWRVKTDATLSSLVAFSPQDTIRAPVHWGYRVTGLAAGNHTLQVTFQNLGTVATYRTFSGSTIRVTKVN
jgi:hypothetical protein